MLFRSDRSLAGIFVVANQMIDVRGDGACPPRVVRIRSGHKPIGEDLKVGISNEIEPEEVLGTFNVQDVLLDELLDDVSLHRCDVGHGPMIRRAFRRRPSIAHSEIGRATEPLEIGTSRPASPAD